MYSLEKLEKNNSSCDQEMCAMFTGDEFDLGDDFRFDDIPVVRKKTYRGDKHLSSPIVDTESRLFWYYYNHDRSKFINETYEQLSRFLDKEAKGLKVNFRHAGTQCLIRFFQKWSRTVYHNYYDQRFLTKIMEASWINFKTQKGHFFSNTSTAVRAQCDHSQATKRNDIIEVFRDAFLLQDLAAYHESKRLVDYLSGGDRRKTTRVGNTDIHAFGNLIVFRCKQWLHIEPWEAVLAAHDVLKGRFCVSLYSKFVDIFSLRGSYLYPLQRSLIKHMDTLFDQCGQASFSAFKALYAIVIGIYLAKIEEPHNPQFLKETLKSVEDDIPGFQNSDLYEFLDELIKDTVTFRLALELSGLSKAAGFPVIDVPETIRSLIKNGRNMTLPDKEIVSRDDYMFKYLFVRGWFEHHLKMPPVEFLPGAPHHLVENIKNNIWMDAVMKPEDFNYIDLVKVFDLPDDIDILSILKDTAISGGRQKWSSTFDNQAHLLLHGSKLRKPKGDLTSRVLIEFLKRDDLSIDRIARMIDERQVPDDLKIIELVPKERELKSSARAFCKLPIELRIWQTLSESSIAENVFPLFKYQSMTMSENELSDRLNVFARSLPGGDWPKYMVLVLDFTKWNQQFRVNNSYEFLRLLDKLHGTDRFFAYSQTFPLESWILYKDSHLPPRQKFDPETMTEVMPEGPAVWFGHESFFEGMRQKGWTLLTISLIAGTAYKLGMYINILGQGDNQIVLVKIPPANHPSIGSMSPHEYVGQLKEELTLDAKKICIPLKPLESWVSSTLLEYSKRYYHLGVEVESALKAVLRFGDMMSSNCQSLESSLANIVASASAVSNRDRSPDPSFLLASFETLMCLYLADKRIFSKATAERMAMVLLTPQAIGGIPTIRYNDCCVRGLPDPVSESLSIWNYVCQETNLSRYLHAYQPKKGRVDYKFLIQDPLGLPLQTDVRANNIMRNTVAKTVISQTVRNPLVKPAFDALREGLDMTLVHDLMTLTPFNPRLANVIYGLSPQHDAEEMVSQFSHSSSLKQLIPPGTYSEMLDSMSAADRNMLQSIRTKLVANIGNDTTLTGLLGIESKSSCVTAITQSLREQMWGRSMLGVTMACYQDQVLLLRWDEIPLSLRPTTILISIGREDIHGRRDDFRGPYKPYNGSMTSERTKEGLVHIESKNKRFKKIAKSVQLVRWVDSLQNSYLKQLVHTMIQEKTNLDPAELETLIQSSFRGSVVHRLRDFRTSAGALANSVSNFRTYARMSTDTASLFCRGGTNFTIMYQQVELVALSQLSLLDKSGVDVEGDWGAIIKCPDCTREVEDEKYCLSEPPNYTGLGKSLFQVPLTVTTPEVLTGFDNAGIESSAAFYICQVVIKNRAHADPTFSHNLLVNLGETSSSGSFTLGEFARVSLKKLLDILFVYYESHDPFLNYFRSVDAFTLSTWECGKYYEIDELARAILVSKRQYELRSLINIKVPLRHIHGTSLVGIKQLILIYLQSCLREKDMFCLFNGNVMSPLATPVQVVTRMINLSRRARIAGSTKRITEHLLALRKTLNEGQLASGELISALMSPTFDMLESEADFLKRSLPKIALPESLCYEHIKSLTEVRDSYIPEDLNLVETLDPDDLVPVPRRILSTSDKTEPIPLSEVSIPPLEPETPLLGHLTRPLMNISTACSKLYEVLSVTSARIDQGEIQVILCLGEGSGSMCSLLLHVYPNSISIYNDLLTDNTTLDSFGVYLPPAISLDPCNLSERLVFPEITTLGYRDLSKNETVTKYKTLCKEAELKIDFLTLDAESTSIEETYLKILTNYLELWLTVCSPTSTGILKTYLKSAEVLRCLYKIARHSRFCEIIKPLSSTRSSGEVYLVLKYPVHEPTNLIENDTTVDKHFLMAIREFHCERNKLRMLSPSVFLVSSAHQWNKMKQSIDQSCFFAAPQDLVSLGAENVSSVGQLLDQLNQRWIQIKLAMRRLSYEELQEQQMTAFRAMTIKGHRQRFVITLLDQLAINRLIAFWFRDSFQTAYAFAQSRWASECPVLSATPIYDDNRQLLSWRVETCFDQDVPLYTNQCFSSACRDLVTTAWKYYCRLYHYLVPEIPYHQRLSRGVVTAVL